MDPNRRDVLGSIVGVSSIAVLGSNSANAQEQVAKPPSDLSATSQYKFDHGNTGRLQTQNSVPSTVSENTVFSPSYPNTVSTEFPISTQDGMVFGLQTFGNTPGGIVSLDGSGNRQWVLEAGASVSPPTVAGDHIFLGSDGAYAVTTDGQEVWSSLTGHDGVSSPAVVEGSVYVTADKYTYSLDTADGETQWKTKRGRGPTNPPAVSGNTVFVSGNSDFDSTTPKQPINGLVTAIDGESGNSIWQTELLAGVSSEVVVDKHNLFVTDTDGNVYSIDNGSGEINWVAETEEEIQQSPVVTSSRVYVGTTTGTVYGIGKQNGNTFWEYNHQGSIVSEMTAINETLLVPSEIGGVSALNPGGESIWQHTQGDSRTHSSLVSTGNGQLAVGHSDKAGTIEVSILTEDS